MSSVPLLPAHACCQAASSAVNEHCYIPHSPLPMPMAPAHGGPLCPQLLAIVHPQTGAQCLTHGQIAPACHCLRPTAHAGRQMAQHSQVQHSPAWAQVAQRSSSHSWVFPSFPVTCFLALIRTSPKPAPFLPWVFFHHFITIFYFWTCQYKRVWQCQGGLPATPALSRPQSVCSLGSLSRERKHLA